MSDIEELKQEMKELKQIVEQIVLTIGRDVVVNNTSIEQHTQYGHYVPVNTARVQHNELDNFLLHLGFSPCGRNVEGYEYPQYSMLSYSTAIQLYNVETWETTGQYMYPQNPSLSHFQFPSNKVRAAVHGKAFNKLKLQWCKKSKVFVCHSHKLEMMYPEYYDMFIAPLKNQQTGRV